MRYIDVEPLEEKLKEHIKKTESELMLGALSTFLRLLDITPTADVVPVRHGWWDTNEDNRIVCSECKHGAPYMYKISDKLIMQELTDYCPYCGARMDGGNNEID